MVGVQDLITGAPVIQNRILDTRSAPQAGCIGSNQRHADRVKSKPDLCEAQMLYLG